MLLNIIQKLKHLLKSSHSKPYNSDIVSFDHICKCIKPFKCYNNKYYDQVCLRFLNSWEFVYEWYRFNFSDPLKSIFLPYLEKWFFNAVSERGCFKIIISNYKIHKKKLLWIISRTRKSEKVIEVYVQKVNK